MNVTFKKLDDLNAIISIEVKNEDYQDNLNKQFKDYRKKAKIPGFRPGTVPLGMVKQMIGKSVLFEEVNRLTSEELYKYLQDNKIDILGQPMTSSSLESETDFDNYGDFTFHFDLGLAPVFDLKVSTKDKLTRYEIELNGKEVETEIKNLRRQNGKLENIDKSETENDSIVLIMTETNAKGEHKDGGVFEQEVTVLPEVVKSKKVKKQLLNVSVDDELKINVFDLFNDNEMVVSHSLGIEKEAVSSLSKNFIGKVKEIKRVFPAELNQEFFDLVMGPGAVSNEEEFNKKIEENLGSYYVAESEKQLEAEINSVLEKNHQLTLPDDFLKRWLQGTKPETYTADKVDELYAEESNVLRKQLIREKIAEQENVEVSDEDINQTSFAYTAQMLRQYGLNNPDPAMIQNFEAKNREEQNYLLRIRDVVVEKKVIDKVKDMITIKSKKISVDKFYNEIKKFNDKK
ncbi:MAG: trigger factor [Bacteroidia bacterium]|nr:trigger factor [Bacteroidia bacterium]|tara:strand:+ start:23895 stop:25271 length:1377 start_codon:yes stop_codon:yes gene_type:complete